MMEEHLFTFDKFGDNVISRLARYIISYSAKDMKNKSHLFP